MAAGQYGQAKCALLPFKASCLPPLQVNAYLRQFVASAAAAGEASSAPAEVTQQQGQLAALLQTTEVPAEDLWRHVERLKQRSMLDPDLVSGRSDGLTQRCAACSCRAQMPPMVDGHHCEGSAHKASDHPRLLMHVP